MPRRKVADPLKLNVVFEADDGGWHVYVPSLQGCRSWGRSLKEARRNIREAISLFEEDFEDADAVARDAVFEEDVRLPKLPELAIDANVLLNLAATAKLEAEAAQARARAVVAEAARNLTKARLSLRDVGELLGLSQEGVRKLMAATAQAHAKGGRVRVVVRKKATRGNPLLAPIKAPADVGSRPPPARAARRASGSKQ